MGKKLKSVQSINVKRSSSKGDGHKSVSPLYPVSTDGSKIIYELGYYRNYRFLFDPEDKSLEVYTDDVEEKLYKLTEYSKYHVIKSTAFSHINILQWHIVSEEYKLPILSDIGFDGKVPNNFKVIAIWQLAPKSYMRLEVSYGNNVSVLPAKDMKSRIYGADGNSVTDENLLRNENIYYTQLSSITQQIYNWMNSGDLNSYSNNIMKWIKENNLL